MRHINIDLETYSSVDIRKSGMHKYVQSPDFEILLFAFSIDGAEVKVVDLTREQLPEYVIEMLTDSDYVKHAYNAPFEWYSLSRFLKMTQVQADTWLSQWRDTMLQGLYCGYTAGLDETGKALGLPQDKQKLMAGKALIRYFCKPCNPTKANGERTRNLPEHDPEKWALFIEYNRQDVVTEMEIAKRLTQYPVPDDLQQQWILDQKINARGVLLDSRLIDGALEISEISKRRLTDEAIKLTGLENPNSSAQLLPWLRKNGAMLYNLQKQTVADALTSKDIPENARRVLELRQELGKTSVSKYEKMKDVVCSDGRVRGLLQFYGANRTGRWAGRLVQVQNLPRTYIDAELLPTTRELIKQRDGESLCMLYGNVPDTLSQLIRTAFVPSEGNVFVDADFSAIEARVIAWLSGEKWRLDVFRTHGKIYEASAAAMFGVPIETIAKGQSNYHLRAKGKVAELALGYQGGPNALTNMDSKHELNPDELPEIVRRWRQSSPCIVQMWWGTENAARKVITEGGEANAAHCTFRLEGDKNQMFLTVELPSGRKLYYVQPQVGKNRFGKDSILFMGVNQTTKKWEQQETYGGKLVENITQAFARDCLAVKIGQLEAVGLSIVFHIHDEVVIDAPRDKADLQEVVRIMSEPIPWAPGLPLAADGWTGGFFRKD